MKAETFLSRHTLFSREELAGALLVRGLSPATVQSHLARWARQGRVTRVKRGVFVRSDGDGGVAATAVDFVALASRMAPDAVVAYHTALEAHGVAQSVFERLTFVTWTKAKATSFQGRELIPVRPRAGLVEGGGGAWVERIERSGLEVRVTDIERTVADVLDRPGLAGGIEEVWRSLDAVPALDTERLEAYVTRLGSRTVAAKVGYFLECRREELVVPPGVLERLRARVPAAPVYMERRRGGRLVARWALIVPVRLLRDGRGGRE
jgi:predicted transcriptional regulator of viral defense system